MLGIPWINIDRWFWRVRPATKVLLYRDLRNLWFTQAIEVPKQTLSGLRCQSLGVRCKPWEWHYARSTCKIRRGNGELFTSTCISHYWWHMTQKKMFLFRFAPMICYDSTRYRIVCVYDMDMNLNICTVYIVFAYVYPAHVLSTYFKDF